MLVYAQCLLEKGLVIPQHHIVRQFNRVLGQFSLREQSDPQLKRLVRTARLAVPDTYTERVTAPRQIGSDALPPLIDASVVYWSDRFITVTGFERIEFGAMQECSYRQSWKLCFPTEDELDDILRDGLPRKPGLLGLGPDAPKRGRDE